MSGIRQSLVGMNLSIRINVKQAFASLLQLLAVPIVRFAAHLKHAKTVKVVDCNITALQCSSWVFTIRHPYTAVAEFFLVVYSNAGLGAIYTNPHIGAHCRRSALSSSKGARRCKRQPLNVIRYVQATWDEATTTAKF
jgi:hypothetical protein